MSVTCSHSTHKTWCLSSSKVAPEIQKFPEESEVPVQLWELGDADSAIRSGISSRPRSGQITSARKGHPSQKQIKPPSEIPPLYNSAATWRSSTQSGWPSHTNKGKQYSFLGEVPTEVILIFGKLTIKPTVIDGDQTPDKNQSLEGKVCFDLYFREKMALTVCPLLSLPLAPLFCFRSFVLHAH